MLKFWKNWDEGERTATIRLIGILTGILAVYSLIACLSYLFTWKEDFSLLGDAASLNLDEAGANSAGKVGFRLGHLLICEWFGLGSFAIVLILGVVSLRLTAGKFRSSFVKTICMTLLGAVLASVTLSFVTGIVGSDNAFGGGMGGNFGHFVSVWGKNLLGTVPCILVLAFLIIIWLVLVSPGFTRWLGNLGNKASQLEASMEASEGKIVDFLDDADFSDVADVSGGDDFSKESDSLDGAVFSDEAEEAESSVETKIALEASVDGGLEIVRGETPSVDIKKPLPRIEPRLEELPRYEFPPLDLLDAHSFGKQDVSKDELTRNNNRIRAALSNYGISLDDVRAIVGPTVTLYKLYPSKGVKIAEIKRLQDDLAMNLGAKGVRVVVLEDSVGVEVANDQPSIVPIRAMLNDPAFRESKAELPVAIGYTITQKVKVFDLADTPHLLVAGATKQGKSVGLNTIVASLLYSKHPSELKFVFIDPKMVEFSAYSSLLHHYLAVLPDASDEEHEKANAIVKSPKSAEMILRSLTMEMDERYKLLSDACVNNIKLYNNKYQDRHLLPTEGHRYLPYIVAIVDEYADLTLASGASAEVKAASKSIQNSIIRLAQKGRAAGIHVIIATQRPSVDVISGIIKANFPTRIAFRVIQRVDSNTILDSPGAEKLIGNGDMIYYSGVESERVQCAYISNKEIAAITKYIGDQQGFEKSFNTPYYLPDPTPADEGGGSIDINSLDERLEEAARLVVTTQKGSTSDLQRRLGMGYAKAGRVMDQLEAIGIVGPQEGSKPRQVLVQSQDELESIIKSFKL